MYVPQFCPKSTVSILARDFAGDAQSTAGSFKSWDTCMDNKTCKIVAIVLIVIAVLICFWIISTLVRCCCMGVSCLEALCCCCCRAANSRRRSSPYVEKQYQSPYNNTNMYPAAQSPMNHSFGYTSQPQPAYQPVYGHDSRSINDENPFSDDNKNKHGSYRGHQF